jgi:hypothetical protein
MPAGPDNIEKDRHGATTTASSVMAHEVSGAASIEARSHSKFHCRAGL